MASVDVDAGGGGGGGGGGGAPEVLTAAVGPLGCNMTLVVGGGEGRPALLCDPGGDGAAIVEALEASRATVRLIGVTHAHADHFLAADEVRDATGAPLVLHERDMPLWNAVAQQCAMMGVEAPRGGALRPPDRLLRGEDGGALEELEALSRGAGLGRVRWMHTPGHTPGSVCFSVDRARLLLAGDTLFRGSVGRTDLWGGSAPALRESVTRLYERLPDDTRVITGHGPETTIGHERRHNPFVRLEARAKL